MNYGGDAADQIVRYSLDGVDHGLRLSGTLAKHLAVFVAAVLKDQKKTRARLLPFSQFTWICPASSTISTLPFKPGGMWLSPSMLLSVTSVPGGYLLRMASILSCVIFLYICTTSFLHLPLPRYGRYLDFMIFNRTLSIPSE